MFLMQSLNICLQLPQLNYKRWDVVLNNTPYGIVINSCKYILAGASEPIPHHGFTCVHTHNTYLTDHCLPFFSPLTTSAVQCSLQKQYWVVQGRKRFEAVGWNPVEKAAFKSSWPTLDYFDSLFPPPTTFPSPLRFDYNLLYALYMTLWKLAKQEIEFQ